MANIITNQATINYNNTTSSSYPVTTYVEPLLAVTKKAYTVQDGVIKDTGTVGKDRTVIYDILLVNHSSTDFTNLVIQDKVTLDDVSYVDQSFTYDTENSTYPNEATGINEIKITVPSLAAESTLELHYALIFNNDIPIGTLLSNKALVNYAEDPSQAGTESNPVDITLYYTETTVTATKTGPDSILCGQTYSYNLEFENTGDQVATDVSIVDNLPDNFTPDLSKIVIINDGTQLTTDQYNAEYDSNTHTLTISEKDESGTLTTNLSIKPGKKLTATITGSHNCTI
ncbi:MULTISPECIES: DUF11 domain-containing protein [Clostridium]|uniref:DUF11 domain-containing protein n=1 Tax=Clostridium TaxID=1485 RepID=UPI0018997A69|nr:MULTISPECIES: DUF11 domain-containing protein [Clostridium]MDI9217339.1 DUF11 domain-containing protein [Clostridium tertium]